MSFLRTSLRASTRHHVAPSSVLAGPSPLTSTLISYRAYAKKSRDQASSPAPDKGKRGPIDTGRLVPGSQQAVSNPEAQADYERTEEKMATAVAWFRRETAQLETRASGRVTPALLSPVRVSVDAGDGHPTTVKLEEVATVGVRDGSVLVVTAFEADTLKAIEAALYDAKIPGVVPQRADERTIRIPIPKPTIDARLSLYNTAARHAEEIRVQIRRAHQSSLKKGKYGKHSSELDQFQKLLDRHIAEVDSILAQLKKSTAAR
ncbi:ribosome recycling factor [Amylostereum chailletii]|nr:ribosome recycling factor [Amylostereum chailletii]